MNPNVVIVDLHGTLLDSEDASTIDMLPPQQKRRDGGLLRAIPSMRTLVDVQHYYSNRCNVVACPFSVI